MNFLKTTFILGLLLFIRDHSSAQQKSATDRKIPITFEKGYGPIWPWFDPINWINHKDTSDLLIGTYAQLKGLPIGWKNLRTGLIKFDARQYIFQNVAAGNITAQQYKKILSYGHKNPSEAGLSNRQIKCYVYIATGVDHGVTKMIIDANNNLDFSDDKPFEPRQFNLKRNDEFAKSATMVSYERYCNGRIIKGKVPVLILSKQTNNGDTLFEYNIPQYAKGSFEESGSTYELAVSSFYFITTTYITCEIALTRQGSIREKISPDSLITQNGIIRINNTDYRNKGVDICNRVLLLERIADTANTYSLQTGFKAPLFEGKDFLTGKSVGLNDFRGKYVLLDFWGTWCAPCRAEIPYLKEAYKKFSSKGLVILSVAVQDSPDSLRAYIQRDQIRWGQILSQKINDEYKIYAYPSNFLIDPEGKIITKNLRGTNLLTELSNLIH